ncbi:MFS transporter [Actinomycetospora corticicola]|uniref:YNFM family putative membrane transporter n=1 Tax=Actinomycetospora corticicola TaxID=663602 RepID=A0A7Y9J7D7_9PSEU|nr:MFS transporter [Actinomycetospora corticicola]NYD38275.1 YNFM family putative membrane transporter [Actinomycetospora corticicola]
MSVDLGTDALRRGDPGFRRVSVGLFFAGFTTFALLYATQPLLPRLVDVFGVSPGTASLSVSVTTGGLALAIIPASALSERWGRRPVMLWSLAGAVVLGLAASVAPSLWLLLVLRGLEGVALAGLPAVGMAYLADEIDRGHLGGAMGLYVAGNSVGGFGGRVVVSALNDLTGSWRLALGGIAAVSGVCLLVFWLVLPPSRRFTPTPVAPAELVGEVRSHLADPVLRRLFAVGLLLMGTFVCAYNYVAFRLLGPPFSLPDLVVGFVFVLYAVGTVTSTVAGRISGRLGARTTVLAACAVAAVGALAMLAPVLALVIGGLALLTVGFFAGHAVASAWVGRRAEHGRAVASGMYLFSYYVGSSVGGTLGGVVFGVAGWSATVGFLVVLLAATAVVVRPLSSRSSAARGEPARA